MKALVLAFVLTAFIFVGCNRNSQPKSAVSSAPSSSAAGSPPSINKTPESYIPVWECIPPVDRPTGVNLADVPPNSRVLNEAFLGMAFWGEKDCVKTLLDAGATINVSLKSLHHG